MCAWDVPGASWTTCTPPALPSWGPKALRLSACRLSGVLLHLWDAAPGALRSQNSLAGSSSTCMSDHAGAVCNLSALLQHLQAFELCPEDIPVLLALTHMHTPSLCGLNVRSH